MKMRPKLFPKTRSAALCLLFAYVALQLTLFQSVWLPDANGNRAPFPMNLLFPLSPREVRPSGSSSVTIRLEEEIQKGLAYARSIESMKRKLLFVHIPKTAGTTIEEVGGWQLKVAWGSCLFKHRPIRRGKVCIYPPGQFQWPVRIGYWHLPTQVFPLKGVNPYEDADLFAVVRDPYDRLLSEFYYICRRKISNWWDVVDCNRTRTHEAEYMNEWIQHKLQQVPTKAMSAQDLLNYNGHFTPQSHFLVSFPSQVRMVDYVLKMDNLSSEITALMKAYGGWAMMPSHKKNAARNETHDLEARHFDAKTLSLFQERYGHDVDILNDGMLR